MDSLRFWIALSCSRARTHEGWRFPMWCLVLTSSRGPRWSMLCRRKVIFFLFGASAPEARTSPCTLLPG
jgi:hypothetical protein